MSSENRTNRKPSRYGTWGAGFVLGCLGGAGPWMYVGVWDVTLLAGALAGSVAGLAAGMLWARRMLLNFGDEDATRPELAAAGIGWGGISGVLAAVLYWLVLALLYWEAAVSLRQAGYFALLGAAFVGGLVGFISSLCWTHVVFDPPKIKKNPSTPKVPR